MKKIVTGILAHVDSGKTTLSEAMLYKAGEIRSLGRVDRGDAFLDTHGIERERGITIFSKQAIMQFGDTQLTLLDTPGHVDFSTEAERTLGVLDYAILVISGTDGVQSHTETIWKLLEGYSIPTFIFVNKMDMDGADRGRVLADIKARLTKRCVDFSVVSDSVRQEATGSSNEKKTNTHENECSPLIKSGDPYGNRTHDSAVKGRRLNRLTNGPKEKTAHQTYAVFKW